MKKRIVLEWEKKGGERRESVETKTKTDGNARTNTEVESRRQSTSSEEDANQTERKRKKKSLKEACVRAGELWWFKKSEEVQCYATD